MRIERKKKYVIKSYEENMIYIKIYFVYRLLVRWLRAYFIVSLFFFLIFNLQLHAYQAYRSDYFETLINSYTATHVNLVRYRWPFSRETYPGYWVSRIDLTGYTPLTRRYYARRSRRGRSLIGPCSYVPNRNCRIVTAIKCTFNNPHVQRSGAFIYNAGLHIQRLNIFASL